MGANRDVRETLGAKLTEAGKAFKEKAGAGVVGVADDSEGGSDGDE